MSKNSHTTKMEMGNPVTINKIQPKKSFKIPGSSQYKRLENNAEKESKGSQSSRVGSNRVSKNKNFLQNTTLSQKLFLFIYGVVSVALIFASCYAFILLMMKLKFL